MIKPDYQAKSIVNLMSSILRQNGAISDYANLPYLQPYLSEDIKNVVLFAIDGMGDLFLQQHGANTLLKHHQVDTLTSVFPSTTASAVTSFLTGLAPQEHALTGWFVYLRELGTASVILPFSPRFGFKPYSDFGILPEQIYSFPNIFSRMKRSSCLVTTKALENSDYTRFTSGGAPIIPYESLSDCKDKVIQQVKNSHESQFIYAYWPDLDKYGHMYGTDHEQTIQHLYDLDSMFQELASSLAGTNTTIIISADHGMINSTPEHILRMTDHPQLKDMLILPLCGEPRAPYCYVRPCRVQEFQEYIHTHFSHCCELYSSWDLVKQGWFGLGTPHPRLQDRIGDYVMMMKDNYVLHDQVLGEKAFSFNGYHGGTTPQEMLIPLIVFDRL